MEKMAGVGDIMGIPADPDMKLKEKEEFIDETLDSGVQKVVKFYLDTYAKLNESEGISFIGPTEYPEPYFGMSESGARLNFILEIKEKGLVVSEIKREGRAYRHTYRIAEEYRNAMEKFLEKLGL